jgi:hypothetical protein
MGLRLPETVRFGDPGPGNDGVCSLERYRGCSWRDGRICIVVSRRPTAAPILFVLAHELAHAMHWRAGIETSEEEADRVAYVVCREMQLCWLVARRAVDGGVQETWWVMRPGPPHAETYLV